MQASPRPRDSETDPAAPPPPRDDGLGGHAGLERVLRRAYGASEYTEYSVSEYSSDSESSRASGGDKPRIFHHTRAQPSNSALLNVLCADLAAGRADAAGVAWWRAGVGPAAAAAADKAGAPTTVAAAAAAAADAAAVGRIR